MFNQPNQFDLLAQLNGNDFLAATAGLGGLGSDLAQLTALAQLNPSFNALFQQQLLNLSTAGVLPPPPAGPSAAAAAAQPTKAQLNAALSAFMGSQAPPLSAPSNHLPSHGSSSSLASANTYMPSASNNNNNNASHGKSTNANYQKLLQMIDEISKDIKPSYLGNKNSTERLKRAVASARILIKDCQVECERNTKN